MRSMMRVTENEMVDLILIKLAWVVGIVVAYGLLRWRLMSATHLFRVRVGLEANRMAHDRDVDAADRRKFAWLAERAYRPTTPWLLVVTLLLAVLSPNLTRQLSHDDGTVSASREKVRLTDVRLFWALISTSPLASLLAMLILMAALLWRSSVEVVRGGVTIAMTKLRTGTPAPA